jgi:hypothetical protein
MVGFMQRIDEELRASGELVDEQGLTDASHAKVVQIKDGVPVVTDRPYAETKEVLAGFWVVDRESADRALAIAARIATVPHAHMFRRCGSRCGRLLWSRRARRADPR